MLRSTIAALTAVVLVAACAEDDSDERLQIFTECVEAAGGSVGDDARLAFDEFENAIAVIGEADIAEADLDECLLAASNPLES